MSEHVQIMLWGMIVAFLIGWLIGWLIGIDVGFLIGTRGDQKLTPEDYERCRRSMNIRLGRNPDGSPLITPGTPTHVFDDVPEDEPLTNRQGHPYT